MIIKLLFPGLMDKILRRFFSLRPHLFVSRPTVLIGDY